MWHSGIKLIADAAWISDRICGCQALLLWSMNFFRWKHNDIVPRSSWERAKGARNPYRNIRRTRIVVINFLREDIFDVFFPKLVLRIFLPDSLHRMHPYSRCKAYHLRRTPHCPVDRWRVLFGLRREPHCRSRRVLALRSSSVLFFSFVYLYMREQSPST